MEAFGVEDAGSRWELYRLLADPVRPRLLALAASEELAVGELAELLREGQPKTSRHASALRDAGLLVARKHGTFTLLRLAPEASSDPVVADAVAAGLASCKADGTARRIADVLASRDAQTREFFARGGRPGRLGPPAELPAYLRALRPLMPRRTGETVGTVGTVATRGTVGTVAVDAGTGDGALLEVLAPLFDQVIALDRSVAQLELAAAQRKKRGFENVELVHGEVDGPEVRAALRRYAPEGADLVFASRVLHHAPAPSRTLEALVELTRPRSAYGPGGSLIVLDYEAHDDQALRDQEADVWMGFEPGELLRLGLEAGLEGVDVEPLPEAFRGEGPDRHLPWQVLRGTRGLQGVGGTPPPERLPSGTDAVLAKAGLPTASPVNSRSNPRKNKRPS